MVVRMNIKSGSWKGEHYLASGEAEVDTLAIGWIFEELRCLHPSFFG